MEATDAMIARATVFSRCIHATLSSQPTTVKGSMRADSSSAPGGQRASPHSRARLTARPWPGPRL